MNKEYIIRKNEEIQQIVKTGRKKVNNSFIIYYINNDTSKNMYCISVSKKLGKAHTRNKIKRRIKDILMKNKMEFYKKYVIIVRKEAVASEYNDLRNNLVNTIKEIN